MYRTVSLFKWLQLSLSTIHAQALAMAVNVSSKTKKFQWDSSGRCRCNGLVSMIVSVKTNMLGSFCKLWAQQWLKLANLEMVQQASAAPFNTVIDTCAQTNLYCFCNACDGNNWLMNYYEQGKVERSRVLHKAHWKNFKSHQWALCQAVNFQSVYLLQASAFFIVHM